MMYNTDNGLASQYGAFVGIDWADNKHDLCIYRNHEFKEVVIENKQTELKEFFEDLSKEINQQKIAVVIEKSTIMITYLLDEMESVDLYKIHPTTSALYRNAFTPSQAKTDPADASGLLDLWFRHPDKMRLEKVDEEAYALNYLTKKRRGLVDERTALTNRLQAVLKIFYPAILEVFEGSLHAPINIDFLKKWSSPEELNAASTESVRNYFKKRSNAQHKTQTRMKIIKEISPVVLNSFMQKAYSLEIQDYLNRITIYSESIKNYEAEITALYKGNERYQIFDSFPGAGPAMGPRVMAFFGNNLERLPTVKDALQMSEIAPVLIQSGKSRYVKRRYMANRFYQQTFSEFADGSLKKSIWAKEFYRQQKESGKSHHTVLRALAFKWIRIMHKCWMDKTLYSEDLYIKALNKRGSKYCLKSEVEKNMKKS